MIIGIILTVVMVTVITPFHLSFQLLERPRNPYEEIEYIFASITLLLSALLIVTLALTVIVGCVTYLLTS